MGPSTALPEPSAARWRRQWITLLEAVLDRIAVAGSWVHVIWIASLIGLVLMLVFGTEAVQCQAFEVLVVRIFWSLGRGVARDAPRLVSQVAGLVAEDLAEREAEDSARPPDRARSVICDVSGCHWFVRIS
jgi:hypothetical protein